jgi:salicylate hydroxylase
MRRALIAGAGIGGLTAAIALSHAGFEVVILERAPALEAFGAGLQLTPNATRILARLGVLEAIRPLAMAPRAIRILSGEDDGEIATLGLGNADGRWGAPYLVIHRADLQSALAEAVAGLPNVTVRLGEEVVGIEQTTDGVAIKLKHGGQSPQDAGDLLIGADGLRSYVRAAARFGDSGDTRSSGRVAFRATVPATAAQAPEITLRLGSRAHLVQYPLRDARLVNLVAVIEAGWRGQNPEHPWDGVADRPALTRAFANWSRPTRARLAGAETWRAWPLFHREPLEHFAAGRVALIGDAAHPMVPFLAQGAAQAIEDAGALGERLSQTDEIPAALAAYSRARAPRAGRVQREALAQATVYHMSGPFALARDLAIRALGSERLLARYDWLYGA